MMSGAVWVRERLAEAGWDVEVADAGKVKNVAPLACKTDRVDARVLAELCRRELVPALWIPPLEERVLRERLKRWLHLVHLRTLAKNRARGRAESGARRATHASADHEVRSGRFAVIADPQRATFAVFEGQTDPDPNGGGAIARTRERASLALRATCGSDSALRSLDDPELPRGALLVCDDALFTTKEPQVASRLNPYISFAGDAREAMEFYKRVFGGTLTLNTFGELGGQGAPSPDKIMHGMLETDSGFTLMGADTPPGMEHNPGNNIAVSLSGDDGDELRSYWEQLSEGGTVTVPLEKQVWGDEFGMCADRFGIAWMVNIGQPQA
jgi:PhnB protein